MIKKIVTTAVISTALLIGANNMAQSKEINLECKYPNLEGETNSELVLLNTDSNMGSADGSTGKLYSDPSVYWFTTGSGMMAAKYQIDRNSLAYTYHLPYFNNTFKGTCQVVESKAKI